MNKKILVSLSVIATVAAVGIGLVVPMALPVAADPGPVLVARWNFDGNANDSSGNNNHGTVYGASWVDGQSGFGKALSFDGVNNYVSVPHSTSLNLSGEITVEAWVKVAVHKNYNAIVIKGEDAAENYESLLYVDGRVHSPIKFTDGTRTGLNAPAAITDTNWHHVAMTYKPGEWRIYVDGVKAAERTNISKTPLTNNIPLFIGAEQYRGLFMPERFFNGTIDEVRIWATALTATQLNDMIPPAITITTPADGATYLLNETVNADWSTTDGTGTGVASATGTVPSGSAIDTGTVGTKYFTVTATDNAGNTTTVTVNYSVKYGFSGLLSPYVAPPKAFKGGSSIPLKWQYTFAGDVVDSSAANPSVQIKPVTNGTTPIEGEPIVVDDPGLSGYQYDSLTMTWQFNWQTKGLSAGTYNIYINSVQTGQTNGPFLIQLK